MPSLVRRTVELIHVILSGADLTNADLSRVNLSIADLRDANLSGADLTGADLSDAGLSGTNLTGANLSDTKGLTQEQLDYACGTGVKGLDKLNPPLTFRDKPCPQ